MEMNGLRGGVLYSVALEKKFGNGTAGVSKNAGATRRGRTGDLLNTNQNYRSLLLPSRAAYGPALYTLLKPFRVLVTVKEPSRCADTLIQ